MNNTETAKKLVDRMLETIEKEGVLPWTKPWTTRGPRSVEVIDGYTTVTVPVQHWSRSGKPYQGINNLLLNMAGKHGEMITFNQCKAEGGRIKKGAKSAVIVFWNMIKKEKDEIDPETGKKIVITIPVLKTYNVFSVDTDVEGLEAKHHPAPQVITIPRTHLEPVAGIDESAYNQAAESIIADYVARAQTLRLDRLGNSDRAYYSPSTDSVVVPNVTQFSQIAEFYSTLFHELAHSTGHASRLNRFAGDGAIAAFGDESYSREELVAEISAATILSTLGLESGNSFRNSAAYVKHWSEHIAKDPMMFVVAASRAEKAVALILGQAAA